MHVMRIKWCVMGWKFCNMSWMVECFSQVCRHRMTIGRTTRFFFGDCLLDVGHYPFCYPENWLIFHFLRKSPGSRLPSGCRYTGKVIHLGGSILDKLPPIWSFPPFQEWDTLPQRSEATEKKTGIFNIFTNVQKVVVIYIYIWVNHGFSF